MADAINIPELHERILQVYLEHRKNNPSFTFNLRKESHDTKGFLSDGLWFQGTGGYVVSSPYRISGGVNKTPAICFGVNGVKNKNPDKIRLFIEVVYRTNVGGNQKKGMYAEFLEKVIRKIIGEKGKLHPRKPYTKFIEGATLSDLEKELKVFLEKTLPDIKVIASDVGLDHDDLCYSEKEFQEHYGAVLESKNNPRPRLNPDHKGNSAKKSGAAFKLPLNVIFYGPPGTGKTYKTVQRALEIINGSVPSERKEQLKQFNDLRGKEQVEMITFHQNFAYEDFIEGIMPILGGGQVSYHLKSGVFKTIANKASKNRGKNYVLIIDEINRGNIAKIFGELITLIEPSKRLGQDDELRVKLPYSQEAFGVPKNLYIIGTMNTADRSLVSLDTALRRRFDFKEMMPNHKECLKSTKEGINCQELLRVINERIRKVHENGREHQIGHAYFMKVRDIADLKRVFQSNILPLLQEYFFDDWGKIDAILKGSRFVQKVGEGDTWERLSYDDKAWGTADNYTAIYGKEGNNAENEGGDDTDKR